MEPAAGPGEFSAGLAGKLGSSTSQRRSQLRSFNPVGMAAPFATYTHGIEFETPARFLFGAGQTGVDADGRIGDGIEEQARLTWQNVKTVLAEAGMSIDNIVQLNMLLVDRADRDGAMIVRDAELGDHRPTSTLMYVAGLANPAWRIEIDFIAVEDRAA